MALQDVSTESDTLNNEGQSAQQLVNDSPANRKKITRAAKEILKLRAARDAINADIQNHLESCKAFGMPKKVLKKVIDESLMDEDQLELNDAAYVMARETLGKPMQKTLFKR